MISSDYSSKLLPFSSSVVQKFHNSYDKHFMQLTLELILVLKTRINSQLVVAKFL